MTQQTNTSAARFLTRIHGLPFASIGIFTMINAYLDLSPGQCMTRAGIHAALRTRSPFAIERVDAVIDEMFEEDTDGAIFCLRWEAA